VRAVAAAERRTGLRSLLLFGALFGLVAGLVLGTAALGERTASAYDRLADAVGLDDVRLQVPADQPGLAAAVPTLPHVRRAWLTDGWVVRVEGAALRFATLGAGADQPPDLVHPVLKPLREYQFDLESPAPPAGSFDPVAATAGKALFHGAARCATCHSGEHFTDANRKVLHAPAETGMDPAYAERSATGKYRTTPLRALWQHAPYFHDGSAKTLADVVEHYDSVLRLRLTDRQKADLVEYLKSL